MDFSAEQEEDEYLPPTVCPECLSGVATGVPYALTSTIDDGAGHYFLGISLCQNPTDTKTIVALVGEGGNHVYSADKHITMYKSVDFGITWSAKATAYDPAGIEATQGNSFGYDTNGRLHMFVTIVDQTLVSPVHDVAMRYLYSDDDGATWSSPADVTPSTTDGRYAWRNIDAVVENNGVLLSPYYKLTTEGDFTSSSRHVLRSTDYGTTWTHILVESSSTYSNESSIVALDNSTLLMLCRKEYSNWNFIQYISYDNGLTWTNQGSPTIYSPAISANSGPPVLRKFDMNGIRIIVLYYLDKSLGKIFAIYATAANLIASGLIGWNTSTRTTIIDDTVVLHYGDVCHFNNNFNAYGMFAREFSSFDLTHNTMVHQTFPSTNYATVKTALGIT